MKSRAFFVWFYVISAAVLALASFAAADTKGLSVTDLKLVNNDELQFSAEDGRPLQGEVRLKLDPIREKTCYFGNAMQSHIEIFWAKASLAAKTSAPRGAQNMPLNIYSKRGVLSSEILVIIQQEQPLLKCGQQLWSDIDICAHAKRVQNPERFQFIGYDRLACGRNTHKIFWVMDSGQYALVIAETDAFVENVLRDLRGALVSDSNLRRDTKACELLALPKCGSDAVAGSAGTSAAKGGPAPAPKPAPNPACNLPRERPQIELYFVQDSERKEGRAPRITDLSAFVEPERQDLVDPKDDKRFTRPCEDGAFIFPGKPEVERYVYFKMDGEEKVWEFELQGSPSFVSVSRSKPVPFPAIEVTVNTGGFSGYLKDKVKDAHFYWSEGNAWVEAKLVTPLTGTGEGKFDRDASKYLKDHPGQPLYLKTADGLLFETQPQQLRKQNWGLKVSGLTWVPAKALAIFALRYDAAEKPKLEGFNPGCLVLRLGDGKKLALKSERSSGAAILRPDGADYIKIGTPVTVEPQDSAAGCKSLSQQFTVTENIALKGEQNFAKAVSASKLTEDNLSNIEALAFVARRPKPDAMLVVGFSPEFVRAIPEARVQQFFSKFDQSFPKLEKFITAPNEHLFGSAQVLVSRESQDTGSNEYKFVARMQADSGEPLFGSTSNVDNITADLATMRFIVPSQDDLETLRKRLPHNPELPSMVVFLGGMLQNVGGSCEAAGDKLRGLKADAKTPEKFTFIVALGENDDAKATFLVETPKGKVQIFVCEPKLGKSVIPNVRVYFFKLKDAVAVSDRGQEVQEIIFEDIAKWAATN